MSVHMHIRTVVFLVFGGFSLTLFAIIGGAVALNIDVIEPALLGNVIRIGAPDSIWRGYITKNESNREVEVGCPYYDEIVKLANADLYKYAYEVQSIDSEWIPVSVEAVDKDHQKSKEGLTSHARGKKWPRYFCFEMPGTIADDQAIRVRGVAKHYRRIFGIKQTWRESFRHASLTPIPPFIVLPYGCYKPSADQSQEECQLKTWPPPR